MQGEYTRGKPLEKEKFAQCLEIAKGPGRTMKQFAEECGVNPSTFSRIANQKISSPSSEAVVRAIYEHRAPGSELSLSTLMAANGMVPTQSMHYNEYRFQRQQVKEIIMKEMMRRVNTTGYIEKRLPLSKTMGYSPDMICENSEFGGNGLWAFDFIPSVSNRYPHRPEMPADYIARQKKRNNQRRMFERMTRYIATYYFHPESVPQRVSFIVADDDHYKDVIEEFGEQKFMTDVSLILINLETDEVEDEYIFPRSDGTMMDCFFSTKAGNECEDALFDIDDIHEDESLKMF